MSGKRVVILGNMRKKGVAEQIERLREWFEQRCDLAGVLPADTAVTAPVNQVDLCVVFGGDGTLLSAARLFAGTKTALLGVNMGKLGFLADYNVEHMRKHFEDVLEGRVQPARRMMLEVCVSNCDRHGFRSPAANDVAICSGAPFRMVDLLVEQGGSQISRYLGDGLVVATPTGSTGYNMSAGGPILEPTLDAVVITPVAPHTLSLRPIVVRSDKAIRITARGVNLGTAVIIDGQVSSSLCDGDVVEVRRADEPAHIIPHPGRDFFETLSNKLQWGRSPHHD